MEAAVTDEAMKAVQKKADGMAAKAVQKKADGMAAAFKEGVEYWLKDELADYLSDVIQHQARMIVNGLLEGNEEMMRRYLSCEKSPYAWTGRSRGHPVIHGELFEQGAIALRKKIVEAHADLLKTERILDLEDQVQDLVRQVNGLTDKNRKMGGYG